MIMLLIYRATKKATPLGNVIENVDKSELYNILYDINRNIRKRIIIKYILT